MTRDTVRVALWVIAVFGLVVFDGSQIFQRATARNYVKTHGAPFLELADPTIGNYSGSEELALLSHADPQAAAYFVSADVTVTPLDEAIFVRCFGEQYSNTPVDTKMIFLNSVA
jgi:hypothetical protein